MPDARREYRIVSTVTRSSSFSGRAGFAVLAFLLPLLAYGCGSSPTTPNSRGTQPEPVIPAPDPGDAHIAAVGDVMLDRGVADAIRLNGLDSILPIVAAQLTLADAAFANLECPLASTGPHDPGHLVFRADPGAVAVLLQGGFDVVSLANNHALDAGAAGLIETITHLEDAGIRPVGAARDASHGTDPVFLACKDVRVGFLAFTDIDNVGRSQSRLDPDLTKLRAQVAAARGSCDLLVVSFHWGIQDSETPTRRQVDVARAAIDSGADLILGHHPHVLQGAEIYRGRLVLYSMGDFVFDARSADEAEGGIFDVCYRPGRGLRLWMTPVFIPASRMGPEYPPPDQGASILRRFAAMSEARGTVPQIAHGSAFLDCPFPR
ncbi:MAG TPA: CapA family protein [Candidatus Bathyarchaeia archaeon]|nr:CapA family protein [Candidatus Bathyarchaeia archaeon]